MPQYRGKQKTIPKGIICSAQRKNEADWELVKKFWTIVLTIIGSILLVVMTRALIEIHQENVRSSRELLEMRNTAKVYILNNNTCLNLAQTRMFLTEVGKKSKLHWVPHGLDEVRVCFKVVKGSFEQVYSLAPDEAVPANFWVNIETGAERPWNFSLVHSHWLFEFLQQVHLYKGPLDYPPDY